MTEEDAKTLLQELCTDEEVEVHLSRIRNLSKGYWVEPVAKEYIKELKL